ncbi:hypothetical protein [Phytohabitans houttuyneae]|uniref:Uncharacterized protein n=2 Tax=Phytohabitans houttuyneae TaxID=1076126 RepID=A0A6V8KRJ0_9ACTN|nr:hypothetical protein [Phytohabitans houttuyneae]GFJ84971.1 hypothetical protein Phou_091510 [Phytohabitans houttuyneae]
MKAEVYHNVAVDDGGRHLGLLDGYLPGHPVTLVFSTEIPECNDLDACEQLYRLLNVGHDPDFGEPDPRATQYRARGNRSLSMGDVACIDGRCYACARFGWQRLDHEPSIVHVTGIAGTTPIAEEV